MSDFNQNDSNEVNETQGTQGTQGTPVNDVPNKKGLDIASLVLGITAIIPGCCCSYLGILLGILAIVFGILYMKANEGRNIKTGLAKAGLITGGIGLVLCIGLLIFGVFFQRSGMFEDIMKQYVPMN